MKRLLFKRATVLVLAGMICAPSTLLAAANDDDKDKKASVEVPDPKGKEGKRKLAVNIGISNGAKTELLSGLKEGDEVVLQ